MNKQDYEPNMKFDKKSTAHAKKIGAKPKNLNYPIQKTQTHKWSDPIHVKNINISQTGDARYFYTAIFSYEKNLNIICKVGQKFFNRQLKRKKK